MNVILDVQNLTKTFNLSRKQQKLEKTNIKRRVAVDDLSFQAYAGEIYGLLGPNGAGKTTTLRILATLIKQDAGDAFVSGHSVKNAPTQVREKIGFLTSDQKLDDFFTPNYLFDYFGKLHGLSEATLKARKTELFAKFGIDEFKEVKVANLSSGMRQKISLVISIIHDPDIIIFDEPTNGLDVLTAQTVIDFLLELKEAKKTVILSTHIFSLVERICDRVGVIIDGRMVFEESMDKFQVPNSLEARFFTEYKQLKGAW